MPCTRKGVLLTNLMYRIFETTEFQKLMTKFHSHDSGFIQNKLASYVYPQLREEPHFGINIKKLSGYKPETWRYRIGKYRLFFSINEQLKIVNILTVEFRKDAY
jgi:mRNA interferase RelE/StbE